MTYLVRFFFLNISIGFVFLYILILRPSFLHCVLRYMSNLRDNKSAAAPGLHSRNTFFLFCFVLITMETNCLACTACPTASFLPITGTGFSAVASLKNVSQVLVELPQDLIWFWQNVGNHSKQERVVPETLKGRAG